MTGQSTPDAGIGFLNGGGKMEGLIQRHRWSATSLGALDQWPQSLRTALSMVLSSPFPMLLFWRDDTHVFYNDSFLSVFSIDAIQSDMFSKRGIIATTQWSYMLAPVNSILSGDVALLIDNKLITIRKDGRPENQYYDIRYNAIAGEQNSTSGVVVTFMATQPTADMSSIHNRTGEPEGHPMTMFQDAPAAIAKIAANDYLTLEWCNIFYASLVGRGPEQIIGKPLLTALPELNGQGFDTLLKDIIANGTPYTAYEVAVDLIRDHTLETIFVNVSYQPTREKDGIVSGVLVIATDVTQQVRSRKLVEASETKLLGLIAAAPAGIGLFVGRDLVIENPNQTFIDIVGKGPGIIGLPLREAMPELLTEGQPFLNILDDVFTTGVPFVSPASLVKIVQNGVLNDNYYNISYTPIYNASGEVYAILDIAIDVTEQVKAQQALQESETHLELLQNTVPAMIFYLDSEQRYRSYNNVFMDWFSVDATEAIGKSVREFLGDAGYQKVSFYLAKAYSGEQTRYEMYAPSRMGADRWLSIVYTPHLTSKGTVAGIIVHATDITSSKHTEFALRASEGQVRSLIEAAPVATCLFIGEDFQVAIANELMLSIWNIDRSILNKPLTDVMTAAQGTVLLKILKQAYSTGETQKVLNECVVLPSAAEGIVTRYFDFTYKPLRNDEGKVYAILETAVDITQPVLARQQLEEKESSLRDAIQLAELGTWSMDIETHQTELSQKFADMLGFTNLKVSATEIDAIIHEGDRDLFRDAIRRAQLPGSGGKYEAEYRIVNARSGQQKIIHALGQSFFDANGKAIRIAGTAQDLTVQRAVQNQLEMQVQDRTEELAASNEELVSSNEELARANNALIRSNEELAQYAYVASHDLQEPLRKIRVFTDRLSSDKSLSADASQMAQRISRSATRMSLLINNLLELSRLLESDKAQQAVSLQEVVQSAWEDFELVVAEKNARLSLGTLPVIKGIELQLNQLFFNLISNALKFTAPDIAPHITISAVLLSADEAVGIDNSLEHSVYHQIIVQDNGIGFEPEYREKVFEVFARLHPSEVYAGTGIGLSLCRRIVSNHGGHLYATSELGKGTAFHILLPVKSEL